jgi:hypothetical protein
VRGDLPELANRFGGAPAMPLGAAPAMPMATEGGAGGGSGDSEHNVEVRFVNAPQGMRSGLTSASGNAGFSLRTEHAMATP